MGRKSAQIIMGVGALATALFIAGLALPMHSLSFFVAMTPIRLARIHTHVMWVQFTQDKDDFCGRMNQLFSTLTTSFEQCQGLNKVSDLQEFEQRMCAPGIKAIWPRFCSGLEAAYALGMCLAIIVAINLVLQLVAMYLLWDYSMRKPSPRTRQVSVTLMAIGALLVAGALVAYLFLVLIEMDDMGSGPLGKIMGYIISISKGFGMSVGYVLLWVGVLCQMVQVILYGYVKMGDEDALLEAKFEKDFAANQAYGSLEQAPTPAPGPQQGSWATQQGQQGYPAYGGPQGYPAYGGPQPAGYGGGMGQPGGQAAW